MHAKLFVTATLLASAQALAIDNGAPDICKNVANLAAQSLELSFTDGTWSDANSPSSVTFKTDFAKYPVTGSKSLGDCETNPKLNPAYCRVAGGAPEVFAIDVAKRMDGGQVQPFATVTVTFNRGGCWVDATDSK